MACKSGFHFPEVSQDLRLQNHRTTGEGINSVMAKVVKWQLNTDPNWDRSGDSNYKFFWLYSLHGKYKRTAGAILFSL